MASIFDFVKGTRVNIAEYGTEHHKKTGHAPILAVNANSWWYANLTAKQAQEIRNKRGVDANPIEENILHYVLRMLQLGINLHFVFDGPKRLYNGGRAHLGHDSPSLLLRTTFTQLSVPWHEAPGEAEAECVQMELEGLADAVWSEDGDAFAYGCKTLVRSYREVRLSTRKQTEDKSFTDFQVYVAQDMARKQPGMTRAGFILNAMLTGGINGVLPNFGSKDVLRAAKEGLGRSLSEASGSKLNFQKWVETNLKSYLQGLNKDVEILQTFPTFNHAQDYFSPVVSAREDLLKVTQAEEPQDNEEDLYKFLASNYQWNKKKWAKWIVPTRVVRSLLTKTNQREHDHLKLQCDLNKTPKKAKATFLLSGATSLDMSELSEERFYVETLPWILLKARINSTTSIKSYLITPKSEPSLISRPEIATSSRQNLFSGNPAKARSNIVPEQSPSEGHPSTARKTTPTSPTPMYRSRPISLQIGSRTSKNISYKTKDDQDDSSLGKGKDKETPKSPTRNLKRRRSNVGEEDEQEGCRKKIVIDLTSSPESSSPSSKLDNSPCHTDFNHGKVSKPHVQQTLSASQLGISLSDFDSANDDEYETDYGSFPSSPDLLEIT